METGKNIFVKSVLIYKKKLVIELFVLENIDLGIALVQNRGFKRFIRDLKNILPLLNEFFSIGLIDGNTIIVS